MVYLSMLFHCCMFSCSALRFLIVYPFAPSNVSSLHFLLTLQVLIVFLLGGMTFSNSLLFHWFYYVSFPHRLRSWNFFVRIFAIYFVFRKRASSFRANVSTELNLFMNADSQGARHSPNGQMKMSYGDANTTLHHKLIDLNNWLVYFLSFFSSFIISTNCFLSHIKLAVLL